jgi:ABC-type uncharacterized transport system ATPase subunit
MDMQSAPNLLSLRGIVKQFPGCLANDHVDLTIGSGEIHALLGENGAGKSTLVKIIYGVMKPDAGTISWKGQPVTIANPAQARGLGIGMVFQHFSLFEALTVAENIALGVNDPRDRVGLADRIVEISTKYGLPLDPARATIMRLGKVVAHCIPAEKTARELAELMISAQLKSQNFAARRLDNGAPRLVLDRLTVRSSQPFGTDLKDISLAVAPGEILGIAGIAGNGQSELMDSLSGEIPAGSPGNILLDGVPIGHDCPRRRRARGCGFLPEERNGHGAVGPMTLAENGFLSAYVRGALHRLGLIDRKRTRAFAEGVIKTFDVRTTGAQAEARSLSGGNLQKFLVGREVLQQPRLLVISQPTWGVDAGAAAAIYEALVALAEAGTAIVLISQDLDEILRLCDRIAVIAAGRVSAPMPVAQASIEQIGLLMGGAGEVADAVPA